MKSWKQRLSVMRGVRPSMSNKDKRIALNNLTTLDITMIAISTIAILLVCLLIIIGIWDKSNDRERHIENYMAKTSYSYETQLDRYIHNKITMLQYLQTFPEVHDMNFKRQAVFLKARSTMLGFHHIFVMDNKGFGHYFDEGVVRDQHNEPFAKDVLSHEVFITEPYYGPRIKGEPPFNVITLCVAIHNQNSKVAGALCGTIDLSFIRSLIEENEIIQAGKYLVVNSQGEYMAGTDLDDQMINDAHTIYEQGESFSLIDNAFNERHNSFGKININGVECFAYVTYLEDYNWAIVQYISTDIVLDDIQTTFYIQIALGLLILILLFTIGRIIHRFIADNKRICTDPLTGCNNRLACDMYINELENSYWDNVCIIFFDLNNFKYVNDHFGHDNGDKLLRILADSLHKSFGANNPVFRLGGDEFICVATNQSSTEIEEYWQQLCNLLDEASKKLDFNYNISASYGYAFRHTSSYENLHSLMERADKEMYKYKENWKATHKK